MDYDENKVDEAALALLWLTAWREASYPEGALGPGEPAVEVWRAWRGIDWAVLDRLHAGGLIGDPKTKAKSVWLTTTGRAQAEAAFGRLFARGEGGAPAGAAPDDAVGDDASPDAPRSTR
ncbi:DUF6429 family protein [Rubricoccus marinus]|uniref:DUF6429 domain-containing protein n=1 Tax=Rubricoccus marinus TaxID=716817 RepID=A0A259TUF7_9BACT|nr:DUF6429 family protein [Rubricoccus marinus]OZC01389.1 hypothetical protein BSZ36_17015 [Rubricoccus marinus]